MSKPLKPKTGKTAVNTTPATKPTDTQKRQTKLTIGNDIWFDTSDILQRLPVTARTLHNWRKSGVLRGHKLGGKVFYCESDLLRLTLPHTNNSNQ